MNDRRRQLDHLYGLLRELEDRLGGKRRLASCSGKMGWPQRGVYFFFEERETREEGRVPRVVRVGTHALRSSGTTLWGRLSQHRGTAGGSTPGGGNHRGSIFRLHVGTAVLARGDWLQSIRETWSVGSTASREIRAAEYPLERAVSEYIGSMPFLWLDVPDAPGATSDRGLIEVGTIALLSNFERPPIDAPSPTWLGRDAASEAIRRSGLWNVNHVHDQPHGAVLDVLRRYISRMGRND